MLALSEHGCTIGGAIGCEVAKRHDRDLLVTLPLQRRPCIARQTHAPIDCLPKPCLLHLASARPSENPNCSLGQAGGTCEGREHLVSPGQEVKPLAPRPENLLETLYVFASQPLGQLVCEFE